MKGRGARFKGRPAFHSDGASPFSLSGPRPFAITKLDDGKHDRAGRYCSAVDRTLDRAVI